MLITAQKVVVLGASVSSHEIVHEILPFAESPVYASIRGDPLPVFGWAPYTHPKISVKKGITRFDAEKGRIHFSDGTHLDDIDHVIFGTGYTFSLPFLPEVQDRIKHAYRRLPGVYQHTWNIEDPTLAFVGMVSGSKNPNRWIMDTDGSNQLGGGFTFRAYEWQAVAVARFLAGRAKALPSIPEQLEWERKRVSERKGGKDYYSIAPNYADFFELLREIAGEPAEGTTGRKLPPFDSKWLETWTGMISTKLEAWTKKREAAERLEKAPKAKL